VYFLFFFLSCKLIIADFRVSYHRFRSLRQPFSLHSPVASLIPAFISLNFTTSFFYRIFRFFWKIEKLTFFFTFPSSPISASFFSVESNNSGTTQLCQTFNGNLRTDISQSLLQLRTSVTRLPDSTTVHCTGYPSLALPYGLDTCIECIFFSTILTNNVSVCHLSLFVWSSRLPSTASPGCFILSKVLIPSVTDQKCNALSNKIHPTHP